MPAELTARAGFRYTDAGRAIVATLAAAGEPVTVADILARCPQLAPSSAYRNLRNLEAAGAIVEVPHVGRARYVLGKPVTADRVDAPSAGGSTPFSGTLIPMLDVHGISRRRMDEAGHMYTRARRLIMDTLASLGAPATIPTILQIAPGLVQSSLYRNLAVLADAGLVSRVDVGDDRSYYELSEAVTNDHHHHLVCRACRSVIDVALPARAERALDKTFSEAAQAVGFSLQEHRVDLVGVCSDCTDA